MEQPTTAFVPMSGKIVHTTTQKILGIDPGPSICGWGLVDALDRTLIGYGVFKTPKEATHPQRLHLLYEQLKAFLEEHHPDAVSIERLFFGRATTQILGVVQASAMALLACEQLHIPTFEYPPQTIKKAVSGDGRAVKSVIQRQVMYYFGLDSIPKPDDAADALATAICHLEHSSLP